MTGTTPPGELQGQPAVGVLVCYVGDIATGQRLIDPLRQTFPPAVDLGAPIPSEVHQTLMDAATPWGQQVFLKSANLKELSDAVIDTLVDYASRATSPMTLVPINSWVARSAGSPRTRRRSGIATPSSPSTSSRSGRNPPTTTVMLCGPGRSTTPYDRT